MANRNGLCKTNIVEDSGIAVTDRIAWTRPPLLAASLVAALAAATSPAHSTQSYYWTDSYQPTEIFPELRPVRRARPPRVQTDPKAEKLAALAAKPQGPLVVAISIQQQQMKVYDVNGLFATSPVSTGMNGHPTPMGAFSVIQKSKWHRSNIYSDAPMPYMQRITWSGIALHAGALPGYPASHGCIRMPMSFAVKMWQWSRMGARVIISAGEVAPAEIAHPLLAGLSARPTALSQGSQPLAGLKTADASERLARHSARVIADATSSIEPQSSGLTEALTGAATVSAPLRPDDSSAEATDTGSVAGANLQAIAAASVAAPAGAVISGAASTQPATTPPLATAERPIIPAGAALPAPSRKDGPVALFISRKDGKVYARQKFAPLFELPTKVAAADLNLGTHVFTATRLRDDGTMQWSVVTLPSSHREQVKANAKSRGGRSAAVAAPAPNDNSAAQALDRISLPEDLLARLGDTLQPGSSLIVSDQGIAAGESGEGTDFIVRVH
jgi:lipoprotein-anchoring transpeptidase ErfK/SrfK